MSPTAERRKIQIDSGAVFKGKVMVKIVTQQIDNHAILYDSGLVSQIDLQWFAPAYWIQTSQINGNALGRGTTLFIFQGELKMVLRHYRRGGILAKLLGDRYLWTGLEQTRAWREFKLLIKLHQQGLFVPQPVAARVSRHGLRYSADLITRRIPRAQTLAETLKDSALSDAQWRSIGTTIRQFHDANVYHADLNAHNILLDHEQRVALIDFDKGGIRESGSWKQANLQRLQRSLNKLRHQGKILHFDDSGWLALVAAYGD